MIRKSMQTTPGQPTSAAKFHYQVNSSKGRVWTKDNYIDSNALSRQGFSIPKGRSFNRLSTASEKSFSETTYATSTIDDFNRYVTGFRHELTLGNKKLHHITFKAKKDIKVPDTKTILDNLEDVMGQKYSYAKKSYIKQAVSKEDVLKKYNGLAGGSFTDDVGTRLLDRLRKQGYSAIVDEMDIGVIGDLPLVIIDPKAFTSKVSKSLSKSDIAKAESMLKELVNRR